MENQDDSVFGCLTELCRKIAAQSCPSNDVVHKRLATKMRSHAYEMILKKSNKKFSCNSKGALNDLLSYYFVHKKNMRNVLEHQKSVELNNLISLIRQTDFAEDQAIFENVLKLLIGLSDSVKEDNSLKLFQHPFTFGKLDEMLPRLHREPFGSPDPYFYYPEYVFELPYSLSKPDDKQVYCKQSQSSYAEYSVKTFDSRLIVPNYMSHTGVDIKSISPMSRPSLSSQIITSSPYGCDASWNYPRLTAPRDLLIPTSESEINEESEDKIKVTYMSTPVVPKVLELSAPMDTVDIWEIATRVDKNIPENIWELVSKMPPVIERQLIATSQREIALWHRLYSNALSDLSLISEKQFIRNIMYLTIGIETTSFPYSPEKSGFYMKEDLVLEGISKEQIRGYVSELLLVGTYYRRLYEFAFNQSLEDHFHGNGLIFEASREVIRQYLLSFRLKVTEIYEDCSKVCNEELNCMPTLLQIINHMDSFKYEIETIVSIYRLIDDRTPTLPHGAELMSYLFNEISLITHKQTALTMFSALFTVCRVYFKFIERFIFEGELDDQFNEFFIRKDSQYVNTRSKRYWDKGFHLTQSSAVPEFLRPLAKFILLCGKSLRLLKHCNPCDPLVLLISSDHPSITCCASFEELERQQQVLDVYRTRCLFVSGEPVTFDQILLKREAEGKAFTEMAAVKQAETMDKIIAERKRLAQLIVAEKQHSLRVLELAMAEARAAKSQHRHKEKRRGQLEIEAQKAKEEVDSILKDQERNKIMEYYSKLNMEVEKSKRHAEWKIKRLQLDQPRMQLLSTEERNLKREKLELTHKKNEEMMAMSVQSLEAKSDDYSTCDASEYSDALDAKLSKVTVFDDVMTEDNVSEKEANVKPKTDVFSAICNVAKSFFGKSKADEDRNCDNKKKLDAQGNEVPVDSENNTEEVQPSTETTSGKSKTSSNVIGADVNEAYDNLMFLKARAEALKNKQKVMAHEFGELNPKDIETKDLPIINLPIDDENNVDDSWTVQNLEAKRNKMKVLGANFGSVCSAKSSVSEPFTVAQKEALKNKQRVLGVEYNLPIDIGGRREPANKAQEEALLNKIKILGSEEMKPVEIGHRREQTKRSGLTLNLKTYNEGSLDDINGEFSHTPGDLFPRLDLETPTTADIPLEGALTAEAFTPQSDNAALNESDSSKSGKEYLNENGFHFSMIVDESVGSETIDGATADTSDDSLCRETEMDAVIKDEKSFVNMLDGTYSLIGFDPFGVKDLKHFSKDHFSCKMDLSTDQFSYTHPAVIMEEVKKRPYANMFSSLNSPDEYECQKITCDNVATLTACLQRSVMLPLTYQLEVVNNSILTYFLVNLEMYEHLRSFKDYFFLMDGEFSQSICQNLFTRLVKTLNPSELLNFATLHSVLDKALGSSISHVHKFSENLSFTITESPLSFQHSSPDVLQCLSLTYTVNWPLNIILSQEALLRYAKVFQFLVKMRRISWILSDDFETLKLTAKLSRQHSRKLIKSPQYISVQIYRHVMASMIRALDNYIVTTCILSSWTEFENDLKKARTLDDLYECHVIYIKKVLFRCLLNNRSTPVMKLLNDIFTVILKFSRLLKSGEWTQKKANGNFTHSSYAQLEELFHIFEKLAKYLHKVVTKMMECGYQRHLVELLTMVNLNGYYDSEKSKDEHNSTIQSPT